jgi:ascorbate-specific PTS system EIIC-type component UlaA
MISAPQLGPLTPREQRVADFLDLAWVGEVLLVIGAATEGALGRVLVQAYCKSPYSQPSSGTEGAAYCATTTNAYTWAAFVVVAVAGAFVTRGLCRRLTHARSIALTFVFAAVIANTIVVLSLPSAGP